MRKDYIITPAKVLSRDEEANLRRLCERLLKTQKDHRNAIMILIALECGLRANELLGLQVKDIDFGHSILAIKSLKGSNSRLLPIAKSRALELKKHLLKEYKVENLVAIPKDQPVFKLSYNRFEQVWRMFRPSMTKTLHSLRHTFAVNTYLRTRDIMLVKNALGHRRIDNTMVYVNYIYAHETMRKALVVGE
jgi:integrase